MTLPANLTMQGVNTELGRAAGTAWDMNSDISARQLAQVNLTPGTAWNLSSLVGRSCYVQTMGVGKDPGFNIFGFSDPALSGGSAYGSMSTRVVAGAVVYVFNDTAVNTIIIQGSLPQGFWTTVEFKDNLNGAAVSRAYSSQANDFFSPGPYTRWSQFSSGGLNLASRNGGTVYCLFMN